MIVVDRITEVRDLCDAARQAGQTVGHRSSGPTVTTAAGGHPVGKTTLSVAVNGPGVA